MSMLNKKQILKTIVFLIMSRAAVNSQTYKFDFGSGDVASGYTQITPQTRYSSAQEYGINDGNVSSVNRDGSDALHGDYLTTTGEFLFSVNVPQGNYDVTVIFGDANETSSTTVKAENRRLLFDRITTTSGSIVSKTITVNRREVTSVDGTVTMSIKDREKDYRTWDKMLTLMFSGKKPAVCGIEIVKNDNAKTLFLCGNSTVVDQILPPWCSWGQMIPCFFKQDITVANYAESGLTAPGFLSMRRLDKIMAEAKSGDYVFVEFGHNDQKNVSNAANYPANLKTFRDKIEAKGAIPIFVTPTARQSENDPRTSIGGLAQKMRETAVSLGVTCIDLNQMVIDLHKALGSNTKYLYMHTAGDKTHFCEYGAYELARCVIKGLEEKFPSLKDYFILEYTTFDPSQPDPLDYLTQDKVPINIKTYTVTATAEPGGTIDQSPRGKSLVEGISVTFAAVPVEGWKFTGWSGDCTGSDVEYTVDSLGSDITLTASFLPINNNSTKVYEAENAVMSSCVFEEIHAGFSGVGYANFDNETGSYIEIPVYVTEKGEKTLTVTYANGASTARAASVEVNGTPVTPSLDFNVTGDWTIWETESIKLSLDKGVNGIKIIAVSAEGGPNIDKVEIDEAVNVARKGKKDLLGVTFDAKTFSFIINNPGTITRVEVYPINGKKMFGRKVQPCINTSMISLPVANFSNGCYVLKVMQGTVEHVQKMNLYKR